MKYTVIHFCSHGSLLSVQTQYLLKRKMKIEKEKKNQSVLNASRIIYYGFAENMISGMSLVY